MSSRGIMYACPEPVEPERLHEALEELLSADPYPGNGEWEASNGVKLVLRSVN